jgi:plasmid replication initiation protein
MTENYLVIKHNKLIEAKHNLNLNEQKIILYAVSKLDRNKDKFNIIQVHTREFTNLIGTTSERYSEVRELVRELRKKEVIIKLDSTNRENELITGWLSSIEYKGDGVIELEFSQKLIPYLLHLKKLYTMYELKNVLYLKNKYSIRVYELLKQYENIGKREFKVEELRKIISCEDKYIEFRDFKKYVLDIVKSEICNLTDIYFEYDVIKKGRKAIAIKFLIQSKVDKEKSLIESLYNSEEIESIKERSGLVGENFNAKQLMELYEVAVSKTDSEDIDPFEYIRLNYENMIKLGTVRSKFPWLKKALESDYAKAALLIKLSYSID